MGMAIQKARPTPPANHFLRIIFKLLLNFNHNGPQKLLF